MILGIFGLFRCGNASAVPREMGIPPPGEGGVHADDLAVASPGARDHTTTYRYQINEKTHFLAKIHVPSYVSHIQRGVRTVCFGAF